VKTRICSSGDGEIHSRISRYYNVQHHIARHSQKSVSHGDTELRKQEKGYKPVMRITTYSDQEVDHGDTVIVSPQVV
jgi:hypothetical protein